MIPWNTLHNVFFFALCYFCLSTLGIGFVPSWIRPDAIVTCKNGICPVLNLQLTTRVYGTKKKKPGGKYSILDLHYVEFLYLSSQEGVLVQMNLLLYFLQKVSFPVSLWQQEHQVINWPLLQHVNMKMKTPTFYMHLSFFYAWIQGHTWCKEMNEKMTSCLSVVPGINERRWRL